MAVWCHRCNRSFATYRAQRQHIQDSLRHHECPECFSDCESWDELLDHCDQEGCRKVCRGCNAGSGAHWGPDSDAYWEHIEVFNVCGTCDRHFDNANNLEQHQLSHRSAVIDCLGCDCTFKTYGGMIIHLESGACVSNIDHLELNATAAECHSWAHFISHDYRDDMLATCDLRQIYEGQVYPYYCPECASNFAKLSSLFQHVDSSACDQSLNQGAIGRLRRFLRSRY